MTNRFLTGLSNLSDVAISEVLRTRMYATDYEDFAYAREDYAKLGAGAGACESCTHQACLGSCPKDT